MDIRLYYIKASLKRNVFRSDLKLAVSLHCLRLFGRLFHIVVTALAKERPPSVLCFTLGTIKMRTESVDDEKLLDISWRCVMI